MCGGIVGAMVGLPLVFLVGRHLPRPVARRRAFALGVVLPPLVLTLAFVVLTGHHLSRPHGEDWWFLLPLVGAALLGGPMAAFTARTDPSPHTVVHP